MVMRHAGDEPGVIADVRYMAEDERLVISVDGGLAHRDVAMELLIDLVATSQGPAELLDDIREVAAAMAWSIHLEADGDDAILTVS